MALVCWFDDDLDVAVEGVEESEEAVGGEAFEATAQQSRDFWLVNAQESCGFLLSHFSTFEDIADTVGDLGFSVVFFGVRQVQVLEDVLAALANGFLAFHVSFCWLLNSTSNRKQPELLLRENSIRRTG
jgi:hypothetical protein